MALKQSKSIERMYKALHEQGHKSNLRMTVQCMDGKQERFFYDKGAACIDDRTGVLSEQIIVGIRDDGKNKSDGHGGHIWIKDFVELKEPRFIEGLIKKYGRKNVSVIEWGKYEVYKDTIEKLLK